LGGADSGLFPRASAAGRRADPLPCLPVQPRERRIDRRRRTSENTYRETPYLRLVLGRVRLAFVSDALVYAAGVAVSPIPIASILLLLTSRGGSANGISFAVGWAAGVAALAGVSAVLVRVVGVVGKHPVWIAIVELVLGGVFVAAAAALLGRQARRQARSLMFVTAADALTPARAAGLGTALSAANPKIMALALGAAVTLAGQGASGVTAVETIALFATIGSAGVLIPLGAHFAFRSRSRSVLAGAREWLIRYEIPVFVLLGLAIGVVLISDGLRSLP